jgi:hypothetical protein
MKKQQIKKFALGKETLRQLDGLTLREAAGGSLTSPATHVCYTNVGCQHLTSNSCNDTCKC